MNDLKRIKNKYLIAEIWELQAILYVILGLMVQNYWLQKIVIGYAIFTFIMAVVLKSIERKEEDK